MHPRPPARAVARRTPAALARRGLEAVAAAAVRAWSRASRPRPRAVRVPGLSGSTTVRFDDAGVPHVRAATEADAFRAVGACHALDRFFQMDALRHVLSGRLCELVGEHPLGPRGVPPISRGTTLDADRLMRCLDLVRASQRVLDAATDEERTLVQAYCGGVNAVVDRLGPSTSPEHALLRARPARWTPLDVCLVGKGMALGLSFKWRAGPVVAAMAAALADKPAHLASVLPRAPGDEDAPHVRLDPSVAAGVGGALAFLGWQAPLAGSNAWVVGGGRSASGMPLLSNDPHLELSLPSIWYLASVSGGAYAAVGATLPGAPAVVLGRTPSVAWGVTNAMLDDGDLWTEEVDGTGTRYRLDGAWRDLEVETQEISRRGKAPVMFRLRRTHRGPLLTDALPGATGRPMSLRLTLHHSARDLTTFLRLGRARTAADVEAAADGYGSPGQNLVWATTEGRAGYRLMGSVPVRPGGDPALPRDGTTSASDWTGFVPAEALPHLETGRDGIVVTANHAHFGADAPYYVSNLYEPAWRARRIRALLAGRRGLSAADLLAVQRDAFSLQAEAFRRVVVVPCADAIRATRPPAVPMLDRLLATTGDEGADAVGPALMHLVYEHLARRVFGAHLGPELVERWMGCVNLMDAPLLRAFSDPASPWAKPAVRATFLGEAMEAAARELAAAGLPIDVPWGDVHTLTLRHPLSSVPVLGAAFTRGPYRMPGGPYTPSAGQYLHGRPAAMVVGASFRQVVDLADPEGTARMMTFGGQSGHVGSRHYDDLTAPWRAGATLPSRLLTAPEGGRTLRLLPA